MSDNVLRIERQDKIAVLTLNRPDRLNALSPELRQALEQACQDIRHDDDIWSVVLTGEGRGFCSGVDLRAMPPATDDIGSRQERLDMYGWTGRQAMAVYRILDKPVVAAVNGVAAGAGMSLALACDPARRARRSPASKRCSSNAALAPTRACRSSCRASSATAAPAT